MILQLNMTGTKPLLLHNGRLSNPLDPYTQSLKAVTGKQKKTDEDHAYIRDIESRGSAYETPENLIGFPASGVWRCIYNSSKTWKRGEDIKRSLSCDDVILPLQIDGKEVDVDAYLKDLNHIDYRPVVIQGKRCMRARPIIRGWKLSGTFELDDSVIDARNLLPILERAGRLVGLGDWRPIYGTFLIEGI